MEKFQEFDCLSATKYVEVRQTFTKALLEDLAGRFKLSSAADVGCGVGYFSKFLHDLGLRVTGIDGREENVEESRRRYPEIPFLMANAEDLRPEQLGTFDLVLCFGLLYHLENPFRVMRNLHSITQQVLLVESMCAPGTSPAMELLDECKVVNQGLNYVAFYPTESCLVKMLYRAGFPFVYGFSNLPAHDMFHATLRYSRRRTILLASRSSVSTSHTRLLPELFRPWDIWITHYQRIINRAGQLVDVARRRFIPSPSERAK